MKTNKLLVVMTLCMILGGCANQEANKDDLQAAANTAVPTSETSEQTSENKQIHEPKVLLENEYFTLFATGERAAEYESEYEVFAYRLEIEKTNPDYLFAFSPVSVIVNGQEIDPFAVNSNNFPFEGTEGALLIQKEYLSRYSIEEPESMQITFNVLCYPNGFDKYGEEEPEIIELGSMEIDYNLQQ